MTRRYIFCTVILFAAFLFASCANFIKSKEVKKELEDIIAYNNAKIVPVNLSCDKEMGSIYPQGSYEAHLGFAFEVQYVPNAENYIIDAESTIFEAVSRITDESRSDCVEIIPVEQSIEDKRVGLYRAKVKVVKASDDIMLRPCPVLVPKVVDIFPPNNASGYPQDSTIRITFNKSVDPESFGYFSCIKIQNGSNKDMTPYYGTPYFSNDNTILNIASAPGKFIIEDGSGSEYEDITITINFDNITDAQGIQIAQNSAYTYRLNKNTDTKAPVANSIVLKTTSDSSAYYYHSLNEKVFEDWTNAMTAEYRYGDFSQNHVGASIYIETSGYDKDSGVNGIQVIETFYRTVEDEDTSLAKNTGICGINKQVFLETDSNNNEVYAMNDTYTFVTKNDGVFKLEVSILDNAGHTSESKTFYVIKDSSIGASIISFEETSNPLSKYLPDDPDSTEDSYTDIFNIVRNSHNGSDTVVLTLKESSGEIFYQTSSNFYLSKCDAEIYYGSSPNAINKKAAVNGRTFTFTANPNEITYVNVLALDDVGNKISFIRAIPPKPAISYYEAVVNGNHKDLKIDLYNQMAEGLGADSNGYFYVVRNNTKGNSNYGAAPNDDPGKINNCLQIIDYYATKKNDYTYKNLDVYVVTYLKYGNNYWYSVLSDDSINMNATINGSGYRLMQGNPTSTLSMSGKVCNTYDFGLYMHDNIQITTRPYEKNSGYSKVTVFDFKEAAGESPDISFTFICKEIDSYSYPDEPVKEYHFSEPTFILPSFKKYNLYIIAEKPDDPQYYYSDWFYVKVNGASNRFSDSYSFALTDDSFAPSFPTVTHNTNNDTPVYWKETSAVFPEDKPVTTRIDETKTTQGYIDVSGVGLVETYETSGTYLMDYYFIPDSNVHTNDYTEYTMQDLLAYENEKHTLEYKLSDTEIKIPYNYLDEGLYTLCLVAKDWNGNYAIKCAPAFNKVLDTKVPVSFSNISDTNLRIFANVSFFLERYSITDNSWKSLTPTKSGTIWRYGFNPTTEQNVTWIKVSGIKKGQDVFNSGFYLVDYVYLPYKRSLLYSNYSLEFTSKEVIECLTGYHVYCNHPVLCHTMYCSKKLTETSEAKDVAIWETKGEETGFMVQSGDFSYTNTYLSKIPSGYYYTTIFHFGDGETVMTPIKQK